MFSGRNVRRHALEKAQCMSNNSGLLEKRAAAWDAAKAILDGAGEGTLSPEQRKAYDLLVAEIDDIDEDLKRVQRHEDFAKVTERSTLTLVHKGGSGAAEKRARIGEALPSGL